uniref:Transthyretin-like protein n=1 Tax=Panagrolaimus sp. PS1159 TaxID=55785 RepID=A0AC35FHB8_9BILA
MKYCSVLFFISFFTVLICALRDQAVGVTGILKCGDNPAANVVVKLMDKDTGLDPDDELDKTTTSPDGSFKVQGFTKELTNIDPQLKFYHNCNKGLNPCPRKWVLEIPDKYITNGIVPLKLFDLGTVNLEVELEGETFDCVH